MVNMPSSIQAALLIRLPGQEPVEVGSIDIPIVPGESAEARVTVDHGALEAAVNADIGTDVPGQPSHK